MHKITRLQNGLRVITSGMPHMESVSVGIWIGVGGRYERKEQNGISHFLEHLLFKGTNNRSAKKISQEIESVGGSLNGFTGEEYTCYMSKVLNRHVHLALDILFDMYLNASIRDIDVERERGVIREEINMCLDTPQYYVTDLFNRTVWRGHPLGRPLLGTHQTIAGLTPVTLKNYMRENYVFKNTVIAVAGNVRHDDVIKLLEGYIDGNKRPSSRGFMPARDTQEKPEATIFRKDTEQTHICVGVRGYHREHPDKYAVKLLSVAAGENMSSRLFQSLREKHGLAYAVHSNVVYYMDTGAFEVYAGVENEKFERSLEMILRELSRIRDSGLKKSELANAREYCIGQLSMSLEKTTNSMLWLGESLLCTGKALTKEEILSNLQAVTPGDVNRVARELFINDRLNLAVIGPLPENTDSIVNKLSF